MKSIRSMQEVFRNLHHISEMFGLVVIAIATICAMAREAWAMAFLGKVTLTDLLLMFLFLEILVMVNQYFKAGGTIAGSFSLVYRHSFAGKGVDSQY